MDDLWACTVLISLFKRLQCLIMFISYMDRVTYAIFDISNSISSLIFARHANTIFMETSLLNSVSDRISSILLM